MICSSAWAEVTPTVAVSQSLVFDDDIDFQNLDLAIDRQLQSYALSGLPGTIKFGKKTYRKTVLKDSLLLLKDIASNTKECLAVGSARENCMADFNSAMNAKFSVYRPIPSRGEMGFRRSKTTQITSYYSPDLVGSRTPTSRYMRPIYGLPSEADRNHTRTEIDYKGALAGKGYELFYVQDSFFDIYLLHVQGGGRIKIYENDGTVSFKFLSFAGKNNRSFKMIYHYMKEKGYLTTDAGVPAQRRFLEQNPDKLEEVFSSCPSYVYFKESSEEPLGVDNIPLTEMRSLAIDTKIYPTSGLINFMRTVKAIGVNEAGGIVKKPFSRFFLSQDTGGSIKGNARVDLYSGYGYLAELMAYNTNELGEQYFLIKK